MLKVPRIFFGFGIVLGLIVKCMRMLIYWLMYSNIQFGHLNLLAIDCLKKMDDMKAL